ncbi:MAG: hypothetical protein MJY85_01285 [Fibrobacter sp.]|nr:hypothetical protein [Fibrobacter sp.]
MYWQASAQYVDKHHYLLWLMSSLLSSVPMYVFTSRGWIKERDMKIIFGIFLFACIYAYYGSLKFQMMQAKLLNSTQDEFTITCVYSFLGIIPLVLLFKKYRIIQFILLCVMFVYCVLGAKRGPVLIGGVSSIILIFSMFAQSSLKKKIAIALITAVFLGGMYIFINHQIESSPYFAMRVEQTMEGNTSRREEHSQRVLEYFSNATNLRQFAFGIGAQGTLSMNETFVHNDWIAILLEQGIFGLCLYIFYWLCFIYTWFKSRRNYDCFVGLGLLVFIGLGKTLFSMYYLPVTAEMVTSSGIYSISLGYFLARAFPQKETIQITIHKENDMESCHG